MNSTDKSHKKKTRISPVEKPDCCPSQIEKKETFSQCVVCVPRQKLSDVVCDIERMLIYKPKEME
jgi:hypothetical protein